MSLHLTDYHFARPGTPIPPADESLLLEYLVASNGTYARGRRPGLEVCMPVSFNLQPLRGLAEIASYAQWGYPLVPVQLLEAMLTVSKGLCTVALRETLFYLIFVGEHACPSANTAMICAGGWHVLMPPQRATDKSVVPEDLSAGAEAIIELHSHHGMRAEFSQDDNEDESQGFRIYAVIGELFTRPMIRARVGLFGHFLEYKASEFFELPEGLLDAVRI